MCDIPGLRGASPRVVLETQWLTFAPETRRKGSWCESLTSSGVQKNNERSSFQNVAVERFADWLTTLTVEKEVAHGTGGGAGKAKIVLCGHSMGGLLAADTFLAMADSRPDKTAPLWPKIVACLAFDTPVCAATLSQGPSVLTPYIHYSISASIRSCSKTAPPRLWDTYRLPGI